MTTTTTKQDLDNWLTYAESLYSKDTYRGIMLAIEMSPKEREHIMKVFISKLLVFNTQISVGLFHRYYNGIVDWYINGTNREKMEMIQLAVDYIILSVTENKKMDRTVYNHRFTNLYTDYSRSGMGIWDYTNLPSDNLAKAYRVRKLRRMLKYLEKKNWNKG